MAEHKSERMMQQCLANGWKAQVKPEIPESGNPGEFVWNLYAIRDKEMLRCTWVGNRMSGAIYTYGEHYRLTLTWRNQVLALIAGLPNPRKLRNASARKVERTPGVPWEKDTPAIDIMRAVMNRKITWVAAYSKDPCQALVDVNLKQKGSARNFRVYQAKSGRRLLEWADSSGFHSVALDTIIDVV